MHVSRAILIAALLSGVAGTTVRGQDLSDVQVPAELPPASYSANQYVDSRGCVYIRAGISGNVNWVPRVTRARQPLCGFQPSGVARAEAEPAPAAPAPAAEPTRTARAEPAPAPAPAPQVRPETRAAAAAPTRQPRLERPGTVGQPIRTVSSTTTPPRLQQQAPTPRVVPAPSSPRVVRAPAPAPVPAPEPQRRLTRSEVCAGRTGVQDGFISSRTGQPVDCGGARTLPAAPAPRQASERSEPLRLTRTEACRIMAETGRRFLNQATGQPVACPSDPRPPVLYAGGAGSRMVPAGPATPVAAASPAVPGAAGSAGARRVAATALQPDCAGLSAVARGYLTRGTGSVRCGPQSQSPTGGAGLRTAAAASGTARVSTSQAPGPTLFGPGPVPASNPPAGAARSYPTPPRGYEPAWDDGRINPQRGLRAAPLSAHLSTRSPSLAQPAPAAPALDTVHVATFADRDQAQRVAQGLRARGLPMRIGVFDRNGQELRLVIAGPFGSEGEVQRALGLARQSGYAGAYAAD